MKDSLTSAQKAELRGLAQRLDAHIHIGKNGLTPHLLVEIGRALKKHELIKVRFQVERKEIEALCKCIEEASKAVCVGGVGKVASFYKRKQKE